MNNREAWDAEAENWVQFARIPGHDAYWYYRDSFFDEIVPPAGAITLEVGSGEGRVTRDLVLRGHRVIAIDGSQTLLRHAIGLDPIRRYALADAIDVPIRTGSVDLAVAYNSLMDFDDVSNAVAEVARVLTADGAFCICITHPMPDSGGFAGDGVDARFTLRDQYFATQPFNETVVRDGITMNFRGWTRPLESYSSALFAAGFVVDALREPRPITHEGRYARWHRYPMFLHVRAIKR